MPPAPLPRIPILDLKQQYLQIAEEVEQSVLTVLRSGHYILGENVSRLEAEVARISGCKHGIAVGNGTDALILALWALEIGPGDEVITPPFTFAATAEAIALRGARAVFVDVDPITFNLDPRLVEKAITPATRAIVPVHLYGHPADMDPIVEIARRHDLKIIEDNAQAIGALYKDQPTGSFGDFGCLSFYPTKNLGAAGDAGMVTTNNEILADRVRVLRAHGMRQRYHHERLGVNSRLDEIQAVVLLAKLPHLAAWNAGRRQVAAWYSQDLSNCPSVILPAVNSQVEHVFHQYTIRVVGPGKDNQRDDLKQALDAAGIDSMLYYPIPLHMQPAFADPAYGSGSFPVSEILAEQVLSLPMYPEMTRQQVSTVCQVIRQTLQSGIGLPVSSPAIPVTVA